MANRISVINSLNGLDEYMEPLLSKYKIYLYIEIIREQKTHYELKKSENNLIIPKNYSGFFLSSKLLNTSKEISFYKDDLCKYTVEGTGGRENKEDIELIKLRMISKTPDKNIRSFLNALNNMLAKDLNYSKGVYSGSNTFYKDIFYIKDNIQEKNAWFDFQKKDKPIKINKM